METRTHARDAAVAVLFLILVPGCERDSGAEPEPAGPGNAAIETWWHANAEPNNSTDVAAANIRRSTVYDVRIAADGAPEAIHESFAYMSVPRSGRAKEGYNHNDGAEFAAQAAMTMSWTSFLYNVDAWVHVEIKEGPALSSADEVTIRPTTLGFRKELVNERTVRILVPYSSDGHRFSVEFDSQLVTSYKNSAGALTTSASGNAAVHTEPRNALMIFADPMLTPRGCPVFWPLPWRIDVPVVPRTDGKVERFVVMPVLTLGIAVLAIRSVLGDATTQWLIRN